MTTATDEPETTTIPHDPEAQAIENQLADIPIGDIDGITADVLDVLIKTNINSVGKFLDATMNGEQPQLIVKAGIPRDTVDEIIVAISDKRQQLKDAAKPKPKVKPPLGIQNPVPSRGAEDYRWKIPATTGGVSLDDRTRSIRLKVPVKGTEGVAGLPIERAYNAFCGRQIDCAIYEGDNPPLEGVGLNVFYAVGRTTTLSFSANHKFANFTLSFLEDEIDGHLLEAYRKKDVTICVNVRESDDDGDQDDDDQDDQQLALDAA